MKIQHKSLAAGRWNELSLVEQMANIGSEVERALSWRSKNNTDYAWKAFERSLELTDFTLDDPKNRARLREVARMREAWADFFAGANEFNSSDRGWKSYFHHFAYAARRDK